MRDDKKSNTVKIMIACLVILTAFSFAAAPAAAESEDTFLIFYILGVELEEKYSLASLNLIDLVRYWNPESGKFLVFYGSTNKTGWKEGTAVADYETLKKDVETDNIIGSDNGSLTEHVLNRLPSATGTKEGLADAIQYANQYADENGLGNAHRYIILWDHGSGYQGLGLGKDFLSNADIAEGLDVSSKKFDMIMFDACLMANLEAAYAVKSCGDYLLGSEETEPGSGFSYSAVSQALAPSASKDPKTIGKVIIDGYIADGKAKKTLSLIDLSKIDSIVSHADRVGDSLKDKVYDDDTLNAIGYIYANAETFGRAQKLIDLSAFASHLSIMGQNEIKDAAKGLAQAIEDAVVISNQTSGHNQANGVNVVNIVKLSSAAVDDKVKLTGGGWAKFLSGYAEAISGENNAQYSFSSSGKTNVSSGNSINTGTLTVSNDTGQTVVYVNHLYQCGDKYYIVGQEETKQGLAPTENNSDWAYLPTNEYRTGDDWECNAFVLKNDGTTSLISLLEPEDYFEEDGAIATIFTIYGNLTRIVDSKLVTYPSYLTACVDVHSGKVYDLTLNSDTQSDTSSRRVNLWGSEDILKGDVFTPKLDYLSDKSDEVLSEMSSKSFIFGENPLAELQLVDLDEDKCFWDYEISSISDSPGDQPQHLNQYSFASGSVSANLSTAAANPTASAKSCAPLFAVIGGLLAGGVLCGRKF